ncbi:MAG: hypothetical protein IKF54_02810 [Eubacterium sp.]|nr:hypothetical protein [Eubacterium sp.]
MISLIILLIMFGIPAGIVMLIAEILISYSRSKEAKARLENLIPKRDTSKDVSFPDLQNTIGGKRQDKADVSGKKFEYKYTSNGTPVQGSTVSQAGSTNNVNTGNQRWKVNSAEPYARAIRKSRSMTAAAAACFGVSGLTFLAAVSDITEGIALYGLTDLARYADNIPMLLISIASLIAGLWIVISKHRKIDKTNRYIAIINQGYGMIPIDNIAYLYPKKYDQVVQELQEMINTGDLPGAYIDYGRRLLVIDPHNSSVEPLIAKAGDAASSQMGTRSDASGKSRARKSEADHVDFLSLERLSKKVKDEDIKMKLIRISGTLKQIGQKAEEDPSIKKNAGVDTFMEMYLPKTIRLVEEYEAVDSAADLPDDNELKNNILDTLDAIDSAAMSLWQNIIHSDMIDISTELDALQTKLVMDGYSESDFKPADAASEETPAPSETTEEEVKGELPELKPERPENSAAGQDVFSKIRKEQEKVKDTVD